METKKIPLSKLHLNTGQIKDVPKNPRFIKDERFAALKKSIEDDPEMQVFVNSLPTTTAENLLLYSEICVIAL